MFLFKNKLVYNIMHYIGRMLNFKYKINSYNLQEIKV